MDSPAEWLWSARAVTQKEDHKVCLVSSFRLQHCILNLSRKLDSIKSVLSLQDCYSNFRYHTEVTPELHGKTGLCKQKVVRHTLYDHITHKPRPIFRLEPVDLLKSLPVYQEARLLACSHLALLDASPES